jgi:excisionase family DNA binding protein
MFDAKRSLEGHRRGTIVNLETHPEPFVTVSALAAYWCVSVDTVYRDIAKGALPVFRVGSSRSIRIRLQDALSYGRPDDGTGGLLSGAEAVDGFRDFGRRR